MSKNKAKLLKASTAEGIKKYEVPMVMLPILPEDVKSRVIPKLQKLVEELGGKLDVKEDWGKRHLAYKIKGNEEGYYIFFSLEIAPSQIKKLEQVFSRLNKDILRFLIISEDNL